MITTLCLAPGSGRRKVRGGGGRVCVVIAYFSFLFFFLSFLLAWSVLYFEILGLYGKHDMDGTIFLKKAYC